MDQNNDNTVGVSVHAGFPNPGDDRSHGGLDLNQLLVARPTSTFVFQIDGGEWESWGIFSGDMAIVDRAPDPRRADLIIWWRGSEFAISRYSTLPRGATVWGVVTAIIHQFRKTK